MRGIEPFRMVGTLSGDDRERAEAHLASLPPLQAGRQGPSAPACPHPDVAHVTDTHRDGTTTTWCPWCSGDERGMGAAVLAWLRQEAPVPHSPEVLAAVEAARAVGCFVELPPPAMAPRVATAWDVADALGAPRPLVKDLMRRLGGVEAAGLVEVVTTVQLQTWRAR